MAKCHPFSHFSRANEALLDLVGKMYSKIHSSWRGERTTKTRRTQRLIDPMQAKLITQNLEEPKFSLA